MKNIDMNLNHFAFIQIKEGSKTVEVRLNEEKRKILCVGDTITFTDLLTSEKLVKKITGLKAFDSFASLYDAYPPVYLGALAYSKEEYVESMHEFYSIEREKANGALAIELDKTDVELRENFVSSEDLFTGKLLKVKKDYIKLPNGALATREYIIHKGASAIVYVDKDDNILLERQYRYPFNKVFYEIPAGKLNSTLEDHKQCALREFQEETGYISNDMTYLGEFAVTIAYSSEVIYIYYTNDCIKGEKNLDEDEILTLVKIPFEKAYEMCNNGEITDSKTIIGINLYNNIIRRNIK